ALLAKEECAAFPLFLTWIELAWIEWRGVTPKSSRRWAPIGAMLALSLAAGGRVIYATAVTPGAPAGFQAGISPAKYLLTQGQVILRYLQLVIVPFGFTVDREVSTATELSTAAWIVLAAIVILAWRK